MREKSSKIRISSYRLGGIYVKEANYEPFHTELY